MMRTLLPMALVGLLLAAPLALAQDEKPPTNESQDAWTKDCPPDMMCAYGGGSENDTCDDCVLYNENDNATYDGNCGGEVCAYGNESCIECSGPVSNDGGSSNCMDGQQEGEVCRDDVQYFGGSPQPTTTGSGQESAADAKNDVPGFALVAVLGAVGLAVLVARRH